MKMRKRGAWGRWWVYKLSMMKQLLVHYVGQGGILTSVLYIQTLNMNYLTWNIRGLGVPNKLYEICHWIQSKNLDLVDLVETKHSHCDAPLI